jgi:hypothetical protein
VFFRQTQGDPALGGNGSRELGEWLLARIEEAAKLLAPHLFAEAQRLTRTDDKDGENSAAAAAAAVARKKWREVQASASRAPHLHTCMSRPLHLR